MNKYRLSALVAAGLVAGGLSAGSASAADLGGNCCADLEERIAELEATTARKGNRKVSLTVSGWVGQQVMWWDDGGESNVYVTDLGSTLASHVKFTGQATILPGWTAGYVLHLEAVGSDSLTTNQFTPDGPSVLTGKSNGVGTLQSFWFIKSDQLGKVSVGKQSQASDNTAILVDGSGSLVPANWVSYDVNSFFVRRSDTGSLTDVTLGAAGGCVWGDCNGLPTNSVRYDSPTFGGFSVSASWGEDDFWDIAARYAGEWADFKVAGAVAYSESSKSNFNSVNMVQPAGSQYLQVGLYAEHVPTGLFAYGAYGHLNQDNSNAPSNETFYVKGGIRQRWNPLGHTILYGEYERAENNSLVAGVLDGDHIDPTFTGKTNVKVWGLGVVQEIDAAAMSIWVKYRHINSDLTDIEAGSIPTDSFQYVGMGALINY
ncbi:porin [Hyphomicrobium sp.]|uniref:porin n=1 Tax=Hyphomicrobium sp. TaxID=82 RepID=UPI001D9217B2|nr:porin [Hyphomicrobium sp.]MBY0560383.1 porin [Hyphomicrobium sp.]